MNEQQLISHIEELGLSNKEAKVYVACLKLGPSAVQRIADQAAIKRVTAYVILESLVGLGLVSQSVKGKKTYFIAEEPSNLSRLLAKREQEIHDQKINFEHLLPELMSLKTLPTESPDVKYYDSADGIRSLFSTFFSSHAPTAKIVYGISNVDQLHAFFPDFATTGVNPERTKNRLQSRFIYTSQRGPFFKVSDKAANRTSRWLPAEKYPLNGEVNIVGDYIIMISFTSDRPIGVTIKSPELARTMISLFELVWLSAEPYNQ